MNTPTTKAVEPVRTPQGKLVVGYINTDKTFVSVSVAEMRELIKEEQ